MKIGELDRLLGSEGLITPSPGFVGSVMKAVRAVHQRVPVVAFPWQRLGAGLAASIVLAFLTVAVLSDVPGTGRFTFDATTVTQRLREMESMWFLTAVVAALATVLATRVSLDYMTE